MLAAEKSGTHRANFFISARFRCRTSAKAGPSRRSRFPSAQRPTRSARPSNGPGHITGKRQDMYDKSRAPAATTALKSPSKRLRAVNNGQTAPGQEGVGELDEGEPLLAGQDSLEPASSPPDQKPWLRLGTLALIGVSFLWGTYTPVLRFLYNIEGAPSPSMLTAVRGMLGTVALGLSSLLSAKENPPPTKATMQSTNLNDIEMVEQPALAQHASEQGRGGGLRPWLNERITSTTDRLWVAGAEMGVWNFLGTALQAVGLEYTTATRAAFIIQSTALFTPLISSLAGERMTTGTWLGCTCAMMGTLLVTSEHTGNPASQVMGSASLVGDACVLGSAVFYAAATVRLGIYASRFPAVKLALAKTMTLGAISTAWLASEIAEGMSGGSSVLEALTGRWENYTSLTCWFWVVFSALGPGALAAYLQTVGQETCTPSQAQIVFSSVPLWSALLAVVVLHEQPMGLIGWTGGLFIIGGGFLAIDSSDGGRQ